MLFGEKYPDPVRMVSMGPLADGSMSRELCGGTHLASTSEVATFEILSEEGVSAGTRRIVALTGERAKQHRRDTLAVIDKLSQLLKVGPNKMPMVVEDLLLRQRSLKKMLSGSKPSEQTVEFTREEGYDLPYEQKKAILAEVARLLSTSPLAVAERIEAIQHEIAQLEQQLANREAAGPLDGDTLLAQAESIAGVPVVIAETPGVPPNQMRHLIDQVRQKSPTVAVLLVAPEGDAKVTLIAGLSKDLVDRGLSAGKWIGPVAKALGGGGGGHADMAQAGGKDPTKIPEALEVARRAIAEQLG
jgi:alanyl-tRNA synthetase